MQHIRFSVLRHLRLSSLQPTYIGGRKLPLTGSSRSKCFSSTNTSHDHLMTRAVGLIKKLHKIDGHKPTYIGGRKLPLTGSSRSKCFSSTNTSREHLMTRAVGLIKKLHKIDEHKVTATADFQKDLSLDSLDRGELVMAFEEEFSIEIPIEEAKKLACCADVVKYIQSQSRSTEST